MTTYYDNIACPNCGHLEGYQEPSHPADDFFIYTCDACGAEHDGCGNEILAEDWDKINEKREAYEETL